MNEFLKQTIIPSDHDLIIRHTVKINQLCTLVTSMDKKMDYNIGKIFDKIDGHADKVDKKCEGRKASCELGTQSIATQLDNKLDNITFRWLFGIFTLILLTFFGIMGMNKLEIHNNKKDINTNKKEVEYNFEKIQKNVEGVEKLNSDLIQRLHLK